MILLSRMPSSLRTLPILERWDCNQCGICCRQTVIPLDEADRAKIEAQRWSDQPEYQNVRTIESHGLFQKSYTLAKQPDGSCIFLTREGRCRVHELHGADAKPRVCRMFPLQPVPVGAETLVTLRRSCPTAAADKGRPVTEHLAELKLLLTPGDAVAEATMAPTAAPMAAKTSAPPKILRGLSRDWPDTRRVAAIFERLLADQRFPLVRRWVHTLQFCRLLGECRLRKLRAMDSPAFIELLRVLERAAIGESGQFFAERTPPTATAMVLFRQTAGDFARLHPRTAIRPGAVLRMRLAAAAWMLARGNGELPPLVEGFPPATFADLERPLGALDPAMIDPLDQYFATLAASWRYALLGYRDWPLVEGIRAAALSYAVALWMLRWASGLEQVRGKELIPIIGALDRSLGYGPLRGRRHRRRVATIAGTGQLEHLVVWYAR
jgi:lysine-N-methylase